MSVEGIPNGWRLVRVGRVCYGETRIDSNGNPLKWTGVDPSQSRNLVIIEMIKDTKQYRQPDLSDLVNGPIEIEACTPDPDTGERSWRQRKLVAIQTESRKPFVVEHPYHRGMVVCYKEARIEVSASSDAGSPSDLALVNTEVIDAFIGQWTREIPPGFMLLHSDSKTEPREIEDCFWCISRGRWEMIPDVILDQANRQSWAAIRRIPEKPLAIPEGWRELNESDFIEQSDKYDDGNRWMLYTYDPANPRSVRFSKGIHVRHIRKIEEPAPQIAKIPDVQVTIYRTPTQADLANGPIRCRVRDSKDRKWIDRILYAIMPETVNGRFVTISVDQRHVGSWIYCEIIEHPKTIVVGDLVRLTARPKGVGREGWVHAMNNYVGKIAKVSGISEDGRLLLEGCGGWRFHPDWVEIVDGKASESQEGGGA